MATSRATEASSATQTLAKDTSEVVNRADRRRTQRERLIAGMITACGRHGYGGANVSRTIEIAGVSRPTFYEYFADKHDCFLAAHGELARLLIWEVERAVNSVEPDQAVQAAIRRFVELSQEYPDRADLLTNETMAGGRAALDAHDRMMAQMTAVVERARAKVSRHPYTGSADSNWSSALGAGCWPQRCAVVSTT